MSRFANFGSPVAQARFSRFCERALRAFLATANRAAPPKFFAVSPMQVSENKQTVTLRGGKRRKFAGTQPPIAEAGGRLELFLSAQASQPIEKVDSARENPRKSKKIQ
jgi:hypothetical protein